MQVSLASSRASEGDLVVESSQRVEEIKNSEEKDIDSDTDTEYDIDYEEARWDINIFLNVPTEVASMIYSYLEPQDFLSLYKGSRKHFVVLLEASSFSIRILNLPQLIIPMKSNYHYVNLMVGDDCMICGKVASRHHYADLSYDFEYRIRVCLNCSLEYYVEFPDLKGSYEITPIIVRCLIPSRIHYYLFFTKGNETIIDKYKELSGAKLTRRNSSRTQATIKLETFIRDQILLRDQLANDYYLLEAWHHNRLNFERIARDLELERRRKLYETKLFNMGHDRPLFLTSGWQEDPLIKNLPRFTRTNWKKLESTFDTVLLKAIREISIHDRSIRSNIRINVITRFYNRIFKKIPFGPSHSSFIALPIIRHLIEYDDGSPSSEFEIKNYANEIADHIRSYRNSLVKQFLFDLVKARKSASNLGGNLSFVDPTSLKLDNYGEPLQPYENSSCQDEHYSDLEIDSSPELFTTLESNPKTAQIEYNIEHLSFITSTGLCSWSSMSLTMQEFSTTLDSTSRNSQTKSRNEWNQHLILDPRRINLLWRMLDMLCWNELSTTSKMMDELGETWSCVECMKTEETSSLEFGVNKRSWEAAVHHSLNDHDEELFPIPPMCI